MNARQLSELLGMNNTHYRCQLFLKFLFYKEILYRDAKNLINFDEKVTKALFESLYIYKLFHNYIQGKVIYLELNKNLKELKLIDLRNVMK